jgi:hypothetical protein
VLGLATGPPPPPNLPLVPFPAFLGGKLPGRADCPCWGGLLIRRTRSTGLGKTSTWVGVPGQAIRAILPERLSLLRTLLAW